MARNILKVIFAIMLLGAVAVAVGAWMVWKRPLTVDAFMSRTALDIQGLEKVRLETGAGGMTVWQGGSGPPLVLLHGAGDQAGAWARVTGVLVEDHRLVIPDLPGHWKSDPRKGPIHLAQLLEGLERVMDDCCAGEPAVIVGNSMGAWLGFLYARDNPDRVARLVAVNGGPLLEPDPQVNLFPRTREEARETMRGLMGPASPGIPGYVLDDIVRRTEGGPAARFAATAGEMGPYLLDGRLGEVTVPVELVWGAADRLLTLDYAQRLADGLPRARLHPVKGCGHVPHRECPGRFLEALRGALAATPPPEDPGAGADSGETPAPQQSAVPSGSLERQASLRGVEDDPGPLALRNRDARDGRLGSLPLQFPQPRGSLERQASLPGVVGVPGTSNDAGETLAQRADGEAT
ncbi:MAG TPA: alpha/beta hydrolase [Methylomirabilota bacterium]|nr:alpha/beta hydrolase [Methylomirabilota bacterium]